MLVIPIAQVDTDGSDGLVHMESEELVPEDKSALTPSKLSQGHANDIRQSEHTVYVAFSGKSKKLGQYSGAVQLPDKVWMADCPLEHIRIYFQGLLISARSRRRSQLSSGKSSTVEYDADAVDNL